MLERLDTYDWQQAFDVSASPEAVFRSPTAVDTTAFGREDVSEILAIDEGENDGDNWVAVFKLVDGRFAAIGAWCDYTGWDCQSGGSIYVANTYDDIINFGLDEGQRTRLGLTLVEP